MAPNPLVSPKALAFAGLAALVSYLCAPPVRHALTVFGVFRTPGSTVLASAADLIVVDDTTNCEDLHYHAASQRLFTACEDSTETRFQWFPPLAVFQDPTVTERNRGSIHVIDPKTAKSTRLRFSNFDGPFVTHGIDVISDPTRPEGEAIYIFAVNHPPNPEYPWGDVQAAQSSKIPKARSTVEIFHHVLGTSEAKHVRSAWHPLIRTPNDIFARARDSIYVTNDHFYRDGILRDVEDIVSAARWTDLIHIHVADFSADQDAGVEVTVALDKMHNNNGLGHGRTAEELITTSCASGVLHICALPEAGQEGSRALRVEESVSVDSVIDNPGFFADPFASAAGNKSAYVLPGLSRAIDLGKSHLDPAATEASIVQLARPNPAAAAGGPSGAWETRVIFEDDGTRIRSASAAVLVAIDPELEGGNRRAWLWVTGFLSRNMVAVKVDL